MSDVNTQHYFDDDVVSLPRLEDADRTGAYQYHGHLVVICPPDGHCGLGSMRWDGNPSSQFFSFEGAVMAAKYQIDKIEGGES